MKHPLKVFEEKRKVVEIDVKQVIYFIREVSKEKIQNCWRKTQIAKKRMKKTFMKSQQLLIKRIALEVDISKLTKEEIFEWFQQFNIILKIVENSDLLSDKEISEMVTIVH